MTEYSPVFLLTFEFSHGITYTEDKMRKRRVTCRGIACKVAALLPGFIAQDHPHQETLLLAERIRSAIFVCPNTKNLLRVK